MFETAASSPVLRVVNPSPAFAPGDTASIGLEFKPADRSVHHVRVMAHSFALLVTQDQHVAARITVTAAELVDTVAQRYFPNACMLRVRYDVRARAATVELSGEVSLENAQAMLGALQTVNRASPAEAYTSALSQAADDSEGLIGLARIRYEGQMELSGYRSGRRFVLLAEMGR